MAHPRLTHLNADTSWLLELPGPDRTYRILIDPWFEGTQTDFHQLFSRQAHVVPSAVKCADELGALDAVVVSHEFTDHCHEATLRGVGRDVPVFATTNAARKIKRMNHFTMIHDIPLFSPLPHWSTQYPPMLPDTHIFRILSPSLVDPGSLHSALLLTFSCSPTATDALLYTPHGLPASTPLAFLSTADPPICVRMLVHGLHEVSTPWFLGGRVNLGAHNARRLLSALPGARYWVATHDEDKRGEGYVRTVLERKALGWGGAEVAEKEGEEGREAVEREMGVRCVALGSGESVELVW